MSASSKLRWKRTLNELKFLHEEFDLVKEIGREHATDFQLYFEDYCNKYDIDFEKATDDSLSHQARQSHSQPESHPEVIGALTKYEEGEEESEDTDIPYQMSKDEQEVFDAFSKLFKQLALILHPDKLGNELPEEERRVKLREFKEAAEPLNQHRYFVLLDLAAKYKVRLPKNYKQQIRWMKKQIVKVKTDVEREKTKYNYVFAECETPTEKENLMKQFINQLKS